MIFMSIESLITKLFYSWYWYIVFYLFSFEQSWKEIIILYNFQGAIVWLYFLFFLFLLHWFLPYIYYFSLSTYLHLIIKEET